MIVQEISHTIIKPSFIIIFFIFFIQIEDHKDEVPESKLMGTLQDCLPTMTMMKITLGTEIPHSKCEYMIKYILKKKLTDQNSILYLIS